METKKCKTKKCMRSLPETYNHKYCEHCRNEQVKKVKDVGTAILGICLFVGGTVVAVISKDKTDLKN